MNLTKINPKIWWTLLILFTWYFIFSKIASTDLWWHMACGRYFFENGSYPANDFFSYTPVVAISSNSATWLGDIVLYLIYCVGGDIGMHLFRFIAIMMPVLLMLKFTKWKYNSWTLLAAVVIVVGTIQIHHVRNSIFALFFIPLILLVWSETDKERLCLLAYPGIFKIWSMMHGYCIVGIVVLGLIFIGEILDRSTTKSYLALFFCIIIMSYSMMNDDYSVPAKNVIENVKETIVETSAVKNTYPNDLFRIFMKGGDTDYVSEYQSPFDVAYTLPVRTLFLFAFCYLFYLSTLRIKDISFASFIPSICVLYLSFGYLRTTPFAFLVTMPFMAAGISKVFKNENKRLFLAPMIICLCFLATTHYYYKTNNFYVLTRILPSEPGFGKSNIHDSVIPDYVLENYPDDIYNSFNTGAYLLWSWYGKKRVFIDGRTVNYDPDFYNDYRYNYGEKYIDEYDLKRGVFSLIMDQKEIKHFLVKGWVPVVFDTSMVIMEKCGSIIPEFTGNIEKLDKIPKLHKIKIGEFVIQMINSMSNQGHGESSATFCENEKQLLDKLSIKIEVKRS